jgi:phospholipid transport system substrate-binding protein
VTALPARIAAPLCISLLLIATPLAAGAQETAAKRVVEDLHQALLGVMKEASALGYEGRFSRLEPVLSKSFDTPFMAQKSVGRHWKELGDEEKQRLVETFGRFTTANYAGRFDGYSGQRFETRQQEPSTRGTVIVHSRLVEPDGEEIQLNYRLRPLEENWKIIDVYLNGTISELALRRSQYSTMIERKGFDALLKALDERISELSSGKASES